MASTNKPNNSGLTVKNAGDGKIDMYIYDDIGPDWAGMVGALTVKNQLAEHPNAKLINLHINSQGGSVIEALAIYNQLTNHPARIEVDIDGAALSSAGWIAMAGDVIRIAENAFFMMHDPWSIVMGNAEEIRKEAEVLEQMKSQIAKTFSKRTGIDQSDIEQMMTDETWLTGENAVEKGFADQVNECKAIECSIDFERFQNAPDSAKHLSARKDDKSRSGDSTELINSINGLRDDLKQASQRNETNNQPKTPGQDSPSDDDEKVRAMLGLL